MSIAIETVCEVVQDQRLHLKKIKTAGIISIRLIWHQEEELSGKVVKGLVPEHDPTRAPTRSTHRGTLALLQVTINLLRTFKGCRPFLKMAHLRLLFLRQLPFNLKIKKPIVVLLICFIVISSLAKVHMDRYASHHAEMRRAIVGPVENERNLLVNVLYFEMIQNI